MAQKYASETRAEFAYSEYNGFHVIHLNFSFLSPITNVSHSYGTELLRTTRIEELYEKFEEVMSEKAVAKIMAQDIAAVLRQELGQMSSKEKFDEALKRVYELGIGVDLDLVEQTGEIL